MPNLVDSSGSWGFATYTIPNDGVLKIQGGDIPCKSCKVYHFSGTGTFVAPTAATAAAATAPALPTTHATAISMPVDNVNKLWFIGTAGDKVTVIYRQ
ncbi:MAG TPA: hypothetical protein VIJ25_17145 [Methylococcales bacterium]